MQSISDDYIVRYLLGDKACIAERFFFKDAAMKCYARLCRSYQYVEVVKEDQFGNVTTVAIHNNKKKGR